MWFWPVDEMIELVLYIYFLILRTPNMSSLTPGERLTQVENLCIRQPLL